MKPIPIESAEKVAKAYGYDQVIIVARKVGEDGGEHVTTYGVDKEHCSIAARIGNFLKHKVMGWPGEDPTENECAQLRFQLQEAETERDAYKERLQIDASGSDIVDELTDACSHLRHDAKCLEEELATERAKLRKLLSTAFSAGFDAAGSGRDLGELRQECLNELTNVGRG